jgi:uncharacterized BrkB/YihY/UPF0761 family membrane protein
VQAFWTNSSFSALSDRAFRVCFTVSRQPSWVIRAALGAGLLVLLGILAIILVPVIAAMVLVFAIGAGVARVRRIFGPLRTGGDTLVIIDESEPRGRSEGRRNVRVIERN